MTRSKLVSCSIAWVVCLALVATATTLAAADHGGNDAPSFVAEQGDRCVALGTLGDGETTVSEFYDYQPHGDYSSHGTDALQRPGVSQVFLYHGSDGLSVVFLHDRRGDFDNRGGGITMTFRNLPANGSWVVEDDNYGDGTDDNFERTRIDWLWGHPSSTRTDGAAFLGLSGLEDGESITVEPAFGEQSYAHREAGWNWATNDTDWQVRFGDGDDELAPLDENETLSVRRGECGSGPPIAGLTADPAASPSGGTVTLDANLSYDEGEVVEYRWDVDGDGSTERTTDSATVDVSFDEEGTYAPAVTVVDDDDETATTSTTVIADDAPPVVTATANATDLAVGETVEFRGDATDEHALERYDWTLGDGNSRYGTPASASTLTYDYDRPGNYTVTFAATDEAGNRNETRLDVSVTDETPPEPVIDAPETASIGDPVTFDPSNSTDNVGIESYEWTVQGGENETRDSADPIERTFDEPGEYAVTLIATDSSGNANETTVTVTVSDAPPNASVRADPEEVPQNETVTLDASGSTDDEGIVEYRWDLDDDDSAERTTAEPTTEWNVSTVGEHTVRVTVADTRNQTDAANATVTVTDATPPTARATANRTTVTEGGTVTFDGTNSTDNVGIESYEWDFGDGATASGETAAHAYETDSEYVATLVVTDEAGHTDTANVTISVTTDEPPTASLTAPDSVGQDEPVTFDARNSTDDEGEIVEYQWGVDGSVEETTTGPTFERAFEDAGDHTVEVTVVDERGQTDSETVTVTVADTTDPTARAEANRSAVEPGQAVEFDGTNSSDDVGIETYEWTFEDGTTRTGATVTRVLDGSGPYEATLTVTDAAGNDDAATVTVDVEGTDEPPTAALDVPEEVPQNETITLDASGSTDDEGIVEYQWDLDGDGSAEETGSSPTLEWTFSATGEYAVAVTVVDAADQADTATRQVVVEADETDGDGTDGDGGSDGPDDGDSDDETDESNDETDESDAPSGGSPGGSPGGAAPSPVGGGDDPETEASAERTANGTVLVSVTNAVADEAVSVSVPAGGNGTVELRAVELVPGADADRLNVTLSPRHDATAPNGTDAGLLALDSRFEGDVRTATYQFAVDDGALGPSDRLRTLVRENGTWTRVDHAVAENGSTAFVNVTTDGTGTLALAAVGPDLSVRSIDVAEDPVVGEPASITVALANDGHLAANETVELAVDGVAVDAARVAVPPTGRTNFSFEPTFSESGDHRLTVLGTEREVTVGEPDTLGTPTETATDASGTPTDSPTDADGTVPAATGTDPPTDGSAGDAATTTAPETGAGLANGAGDTPLLVVGVGLFVLVAASLTRVL